MERSSTPNMSEVPWYVHLVAICFVSSPTLDITKALSHDAVAVMLIFSRLKPAIPLEPLCSVEGEGVKAGRERE